MNSTARSLSNGGMANANDFAVFRLITRKYRLDCCTDKSPGLAPPVAIFGDF
jgi:hypothetical protein